MSVCLAVGAAVLHLSVPRFTLSWTHSVEKVIWEETWTVADGLSNVTDRIKGSGAGMEPGDDARLEDGWWVWHPGTEVPALVLAASGATGGGWTFCADGACRVLGAEAGAPVRIAPC